MWEHYLKQMVRCENQIGKIAAAWRCTVCDAKFGKTFTSSSSEKKSAVVSPQQCAVAMDYCVDFMVSDAKFLGNFFKIFTNFIIEAKFKDQKELDLYVPNDHFVENQICKKDWEKYKTVGRKVECLFMCERIYQRVMTPFPRVIDTVYFNGLEFMFKHLAPSKPDYLTKI